MMVLSHICVEDTCGCPSMENTWNGSGLVTEPTLLLTCQAQEKPGSPQSSGTNVPESLSGEARVRTSARRGPGQLPFLHNSREQAHFCCLGDCPPVVTTRGRPFTHFLSVLDAFLDELPVHTFCPFSLYA